MKNLSKRSAGVLLHPTSLPSRFGIGDLGREAFRFIDALASAKQSWWQMLPVNPVGPGNSPYSTVCSFAGEALLICPEKLAEEGLLKANELKSPLSAAKYGKRVDYAAVRKFKNKLLRLAHTRFNTDDHDYRVFIETQKHWLADHALFCALSKRHKTVDWSEWPEPVRLRDANALQKARSELHDEIQYYYFEQYCFYKQWRALKKYANDRNVALIGDIPIFVSFESADVWGNQEFFWITPEGKQQYLAGVPPDFFNKDGQCWCNALYRWDRLKADRFSWWVNRFKHMGACFDVVRIDHFIGFYRYWEIPAGAKTAKTGTWRLAEGDAMFAEVQRQLGGLPFIAEDLGLVTKEVTALREKYQLPAMKVLQFAFANDGGKNTHKPCHYERNCVVYTGTHDNDTTVGWYKAAKAQARSKKPSYDFRSIQAYCPAPEAAIHWGMIGEIMKSVANTAMTPMQDILGLDGKSRMNVPGTPKRNWEWRFSWAQCKPAMWQKLKDLTIATDR